MDSSCRQMSIWSLQGIKISPKESQSQTVSASKIDAQQTNTKLSTADKVKSETEFKCPWSRSLITALVQGLVLGIISTVWALILVIVLWSNSQKQTSTSSAENTIFHFRCDPHTCFSRQSYINSTDIELSLFADTVSSSDFGFMASRWKPFGSEQCLQCSIHKSTNGPVCYWKHWSSRYFRWLKLHLFQCQILGYELSELDDRSVSDCSRFKCP